MERGIGFLLVTFGLLSLVGSALLGFVGLLRPQIPNVILALVFVAVGILLAKKGPPASAP